MDKLRIFVSGNGDLTSDIVFSSILNTDIVDIVGISNCATYTKSRESKLSQALKILKKTDFKFWVYLVFQNGFYELRKIIEKAVGLGAHISLEKYAIQNGIPYFSVDDYNSPSFEKILTDANPHLHVLRISQILHEKIFEIPRHGTWCVHSSLLPSYGGAAAEFYALTNTEDKIGSSVFQLDEKIDLGPIVNQGRIKTRRSASLFHHTLANNLVGREIILQAIIKLHKADQVPRLKFVPEPRASYRMWPNKTDIVSFKSQNGYFLSLSEIAKFIAFCLGLRASLPVGMPSIEFPPEN